MTDWIEIEKGLMICSMILPTGGRMSDDVFLKLKTCKQCTYLTSRRHYTADSFENVIAWECTMNANPPRIIALLDWNDKVPGIPEWCPLRS